MSFHLNLDTETVDQCFPAEPLCLAPGVSMREALRQMREHNRGVVLVWTPRRSSASSPSATR